MVKTAVYLQNWTSTAGGIVSSHTLYFEKKALNLVHLRVFGNIDYVHVPKEKQRNLVKDYVWKR